VQLVRSDQVRAVGERCVQFLLPRAAGGAQPDLEDLAPMRRLGCTPDRAQKPVPHAGRLLGKAVAAAERDAEEGNVGA
jgi:hypothetical protein